MKQITLIVLGVLFATTAFAAGNVKLYAPLQFLDGTTQSTATLQGPQGPIGATGPQGNPGVQGPQGVQGAPGPSITGKTRYKNVISTNFIPAIGSNAAYTQTYSETSYYDTTGKTTGWSGITMNGNIISSTTVCNYTEYDAHDAGIAGYQIFSNSPIPVYITQSATYDSEGRRSQRVKKVYDSSNNVTRTITTNYDVDHHGAYISTINVSGNVTTTVTYANNYDSNGYQTTATTLTEQYNSSTNTTISWPGTAVYEYVFIPDVQYPTKISGGY